MSVTVFVPGDAAALALGADAVCAAIAADRLAGFGAADANHVAAR